MAVSKAGLPQAVQAYMAKLLKRGIGPESLKESYATKENLPEHILFRVNGASLQVSLDGGQTWKTVTLT